jgi:outer membrane protein OmpA-like peptidoglycan-associated protein
MQISNSGAKPHKSVSATATSQENRTGTAENKRAIVYGIYFDFNQVAIKPESESVLKEIAQAIADHYGLEADRRRLYH